MKYLTNSQYDFEKLIRGGYLYVDKTEYVWKMVQTPFEAFFFSRPRRFGKSLLVSTLKAVFEGKKELFQGLALYDKPYDWKKYPVIHLDLGSCQSDTAEKLEKKLQNSLANIASKLGLSVRGEDASSQFSNLIFDASKNAPVVVLIDEYDKPILGNLVDKEGVHDILRKLKEFYSVIKTSSSLLRFVFLTGVSKFSHVSVFSDLNNLTDITMDARYATMLGYTQEEFERDFAEQITQTEASQTLPHDEYLGKIKRWYDGFCFEENSESVYNPVSLASFFLNDGKFSNYWFATGTTSFLLELVKRQNFDFEKLLKEPVTEIAFSAYEVDNLQVLPLLLQTGYLTIRSAKCLDDQTLFYLDFPNLEVKNAFETYLLNAYMGIEAGTIKGEFIKLKDFVKKGDVDGFMNCLQSLFASIPYSIQVRDEKYYQTIFFQIFQFLGIDTTAEAQTNNGRIDAVVSCGDWVYIFEFKLDTSAEIALEQIKDRQYYQKYQFIGKKIVLVGANFDFEKRQLCNWKSLVL